MSQEYTTTALWKNDFKASEQENRSRTVFHNVEGVGQEEGYSCGTAVLASVLLKKGIETSDNDLMEQARAILAEKGLDVEEIGTPPFVIKEILGQNNIPYIEKQSDPTFEDADLTRAEAWLESRIQAGFVCITPIQTTSEYWVRNTVTGKIAPESSAESDEAGKVRNDKFRINPNYEVIHTLAADWKDRTQAPETTVSNDGKTEGVVPATTKDDVDYNGHYVLVVGEMSSGGRDFFIIRDPMYKWWTDDIENIDPKQSGVRFVEKDFFMRRWHDRSGEGKNFNQYAIAVQIAESEK